MIRIVLLVALVLGPTHSSDADDWPQWLGPNREPVWRESQIIDTFPASGPPLRWQVKLGGGYSGPAVADGRVFVMDRIFETDGLQDGELLHEGEAPQNLNFLRRKLAGKERVVCLRESDGQELWTREYNRPYTTVALYAIGPRCTPTVDGDLVYTLGAEGDLLCLRVTDGSVVWSKDFVSAYGLKMPEWGVASHPLIDGDRLICVVGGEGSTVVAFDKRTGEELWKALSARQPGYCAPVIYEIHGKRQLIIWDSDQVSGLSPETGDVYWSTRFEPTFAMSIGAPQVQNDQLFLMAFNRKSAMIRVARNDTAKIEWTGSGTRGIGGVLNTAIIHDGHIYACGSNGRYICARLEDGKRVWQTYQLMEGERPKPWGNVFTIQHENRFFHANDVGNLIIAKMSPSGYEEVSRAHLIDPTHDVSGRRLVWSHPAFANRSVYLRNDHEIRCYSLARPTAP